MMVYFHFLLYALIWSKLPTEGQNRAISQPQN